MILLDAFFHLLFPELCLNCRRLVSSGSKKVCQACLEELTLLPLEERCLRCFAAHSKARCSRCIKRGSPFKRVASAFEFDGTAASLIHQLKFARREELAQDLASWMVIQFLKLNIPLPDLVIPVPQPWMRRLSRGYNPSSLIAQEVAKLLERPTADLLTRRSGDFPQRALSKAAREALSSNPFGWKRECDISDKIVLLVDDVMTTGSTLYQCGRVLQEGFPSALYALTFCSTEG